MSSFTISITVWALDQPCSSARGLYTRSFGCPEANVRAKDNCAIAAPYRSSGARSERSSGSMLS